VSLHHYQEDHGLDGETLLEAAYAQSPDSSPADNGNHPADGLPSSGPDPVGVKRDP